MSTRLVLPGGPRGLVQIPKKTELYGIALENATFQSVTSTFADTPLSLTVPAGIWKVSVQARFRNAGAVSGSKIQIAQTGAVFLAGSSSKFISNGNVTSYMNDQASGASQIAFPGANDSHQLSYDYMFSVAAEATFTVQMAQDTTDAAPAIMVIGSVMQISRVLN